MDTFTLFFAYKRATANKYRAQEHGGMMGIACRDDYYARQWQRWDRLARKLDIRIGDALGRERTWDACCMCGWHRSACACREFVPMRKNGEWFELDDSDVEYIKGL